MPNSTIKIFKRMKEFRGFSGKAETAYVRKEG